MHKLDPRTKILSLILISSLIFTINNPVSFLIVFSILFFVLLAFKIPLKLFIKGFRPILVFLLLTFCLHLFFTAGENIIFSFWKIVITKEGIIRGIVIVSRIILLISLATIVTMTSRISKVVVGLESMLGFLKIFRINPRIIPVMIGLSIRFIPLLFLKVDRVVNSLKMRGVIFNEGVLRERAKKYALAIDLVWRSMTVYIDTLSVSMYLRGFSVEKDRSSIYVLSFTWRDGVVLGLGIMLVGIWMFRFL
ncbi:MAG: energy-coupling factor transporter transmembrane component T [Elusimicrobiota bacterium]